MMYMIATVLFATLQTSSQSTGIHIGATATEIGKVRPGNYAAMRDYRTLPLIADLSQSRRQTFTGTIIALDFPQRGSIHVMNYKNGKRVVLDNPKQTVKENGVPLTKMLASISPRADVRFAGINGASFEVKLPGEEKKLADFSGTLTAFSSKPKEKGISIILVGGKVRSSALLKPAGLHK
jgi:hypothetical protein